MKLLARFSYFLLLTTVLMVVGKIIEYKFITKHKLVFGCMWGLTILFLYSVWIFLESYYDLRLSPGIEGNRGVKGKRGVIGLRGKCNYPTYNGPLKTDNQHYYIDTKNKKYISKVGPLKRFIYSTLERLTGKNAGVVVGNKINGKPIDFRKCKQMCNSNDDCRSFYYKASQDMDKKTGDTLETKQCVFFNTNCKNAGSACSAQTLDVDDYIDTDLIGLYEKQ